MVADRLARVLTRIYVAARSKRALDGAGEEASGSLGDLQGHNYCLLLSYRMDGSPVPTPLWFGVGGGRLYFQTGATDGKIKRIRRNATVRVAPCTARGRPLGPFFEGKARVLSPAEESEAEAWIEANYGLGRRLYERLLAQRVASVYVEVTPSEP